MLTCEFDPSAPVVVLHLAGTLDLAAVVDVRVALHKAAAAAPTAVVVDLDDTVVIDHVALTVFAAFARSAAEWPRCPVLLSTGDPLVRDYLNRFAARLVHVHADRATAVAMAEAAGPPRRSRRSIPATPTAPSMARRLVREACQEWQVTELVDDAELIVTELVSNAVRHVGATTEVLVTLRERYLILSVHDPAVTPPVRGLPDPETGEGGRGLLLLDDVATAWGWREAVRGKIVWAALAVRRGR